MISFTIPFLKLAAAALFASHDECRYILNVVRVERQDAKKILLVATDGKRIAIIRHQVSDNLPEFESFSIPLPLIDRADITIKARAYETLAYELEDDEIPSYAAANPDAVLTFDGKTVSMTMPNGITFLATSGKELKQFPFWKSTLADLDKGQTNKSVISVSGFLMRDFCRAAAMLSPNVGAHLLITGYGKHGNGKPIVNAIRIPNNEDFFGLLMPIKCEEHDSATKPDWL
ncbi:hypothetical protein [Geminisphaera colitermitum]|uniref:hypothetical protein n=1 Tax=Geminisphaera colitermitum TaxID=1148786 RepID=UPI0001964E5F|nr:hypothetical protein [Geminisphaera colitermitum]